MEDVAPIPKVRLDFALMRKTLERDGIAVESSEECERVRTLRLDWSGIDTIEDAPFELFPNVKDLYLQQNNIASIEGLEMLQRLTFLALHHNNIVSIDALKRLPRLECLDVSFNQIESLHPEELPPSLVILRINGNPCCGEDSGELLSSCVACLPNLAVFNGRAPEEEEEEEEAEEEHQEGNADETQFVDEENPTVHSERRAAFLQQQKAMMKEREEELTILFDGMYAEKQLAFQRRRDLIVESLRQSMEIAELEYLERAPLREAARQRGFGVKPPEEKS